MSFARITYYYKRSFTDFRMTAMHTHGKNCYEIMYVAAGSCSVELSDRTEFIPSGSYILLRADCPHALSAHSADILNVEFSITDSGVDISDVEREILAFTKLLERQVSVTADSGGVLRALSDLVEEIGQNGDGLCSALLLKRLLIELCRADTRRFAAGAFYVRSAQEYIKEHLCERLTVQEIADAVGLNRSYLQTLFKKQSGKTVIEYINSLRMEKACFIMRNTDIPIIDIAVDCGFASRQHFMYVFKMHTGMTAREYRRKP